MRVVLSGCWGVHDALQTILFSCFVCGLCGLLGLRHLCRVMINSHATGCVLAMMRVRSVRRLLSKGFGGLFDEFRFYFGTETLRIINTLIVLKICFNLSLFLSMTPHTQPRQGKR
jgi:hypothetical protein